jgi:hypothetical protein
MSFGASFYAANKTNLFKVRPIHFYQPDFNPKIMIINSTDYYKEVQVFSSTDR